MSSRGTIRIRGARQNNLKGFDLDLPLGKIIAVTGVSGSGKSSLAFDTLYAEGQRRYVETFSPYARQFMERMDRPRVGSIENIPPAIAIDRKDPVRTSRSTVGTMTEITDYVKLLYARLGQLHCKACGKPVLRDTPEDAWENLASHGEGSRTIITFPVLFESAHHKELKRDLGRAGFSRLLTKGKITDLGEWEPVPGEAWIHVVVDRFPLRLNEKERVLDSLEQAFRFGEGKAGIHIAPDIHLSFSSDLECPDCGIPYSPPTPHLFSFNSPVGACETCRGFGRIIDIDLDLIIPDKGLSLEEGAVKPWGGRRENRVEYQDLKAFCGKSKIPMDIPFYKLPKKVQEAVIEGDKDFYGVRGFFNWLETKTYKMHVRVYLSRYRTYRVCEDCGGSRFKEESLLYSLGGLSISEVYAGSIDRAETFFKGLENYTDDASRLILEEVLSRIHYLQNVGLGYLTLDRQSRTLSGGEVQRVALTSALGSNLVNTLYVLDEPSIGLHPRDAGRLVGILEDLRDLDNTIVVVEHDPEIIKNSDVMVDMGPQAGEKGGCVTYFGPPASAGDSVTGQYLCGKRSIPVPKVRRIPSESGWLVVKGASENNLKDMDVRIPTGLLVGLTGVSGSGKSTLVEEILYKGIKRSTGHPEGRPGAFKTLTGLDLIRDIHLVDQRPVGRTPRANALTYTKALGPVRDLLASTPEARRLGMGAGHFSFNVTGGRCEACKGQGFEKVEMQFLSDVFITCQVCGGSRFKEEVLSVKYQGKSIHDILTLTVNEALEFFKDNRKIVSLIKPLTRVGLGYLRLGQPLNTLSGGEAQRLKLSGHLGGKGKGREFFLFDEPTTGLHFEDIKILIEALQGLVERGHTVLVIEHNMDVIKACDWVLDLGPEGGDRGGEIVAQGPPEKIARTPSSHTGQHLGPYLQKAPRVPPSAPSGHTIAEPPASFFEKSIHITNARVHNLSSLSLSVPRDKLVVITGVSGSGKSSLAFDILFEEGQRRYLESLTPYVRQYVGVLDRPDVDTVSGIPPTVAIDQRMGKAGQRSTVATITEIYHFLRLLYSKLGTLTCPGCGRSLVILTEQELVDRVRKQYRGQSARILVPKVVGRKGFHKDVFARALKAGYREARIDGEICRLGPDMALSRYKEHEVELVIGLLSSDSPEELIRKALEEGDGQFLVLGEDGSINVFSIRGVCPTCGIGLEEPDPRLFSFNSRHGACPECDGLGVTFTPGGAASTCETCGGSRLRKEALAVKIGGRSIWDIVRLPAEKAADRLKDFQFRKGVEPIHEPIMDELIGRLSFMKRLGLGYLGLDRSGNTLSGGEAQRLRITSQLGSNLAGVCYVLDEPTIGLHARDNRMLLDALCELRDRGNSVIVVEHDEETIRAADHILDLGPGGGRAGGRLIASGKLEDLKKNKESVTGAWFNGKKRQITSRMRPYRDLPCIRVVGASANNLRDVDVSFPLGTLTCVTGVSGSGKSTLIRETLYRGLRERLRNENRDREPVREILGWQSIDRALEVDHNPIGKTPRSVPASYVGFLSQIRTLLAGIPQARTRGFKPGRFSFNTPGGRCEPCKGHGAVKTEMSFLPDVYVPCEVCGGRRFNQQTLAVLYKGKNISEILDMTFDEAFDFFDAIPRLKKAIRVVRDIGLGYLRLGQPSPTLSGGEAQRIKLACELAKPASGKTLYVLDEPTTGLHASDVRPLLDVIQALIDNGNTVVVIEHNVEVIKEADYIVDLGPEGGDRGGIVVASGSPEEIIAFSAGSHTGAFLKKYLKGK